MLLVGAALKGFALLGRDGIVGTVGDLLFDDRTWQMRWIVVDTGSWLTGRKVLIHPSAIGQADHDRMTLSVTLTKAQVKDSPDISTDQPVSQQMETDLRSYYGWDPLWGDGLYGAGLMGTSLGPPRYFGGTLRHDLHDRRLEDEDPHLRSMSAIKGYHVHATDGQIGHVENLLVDDASWGIRYLIIDTSNWWIGQHVLMSPYAVREISWPAHEIRLDVTRERVKTSPAWKPLDLLHQAYEKQLHGHYGWSGYGWPLTTPT